MLPLLGIWTFLPKRHLRAFATPLSLYLLSQIRTSIWLDCEERIWGLGSFTGKAFGRKLRDCGTLIPHLNFDDVNNSPEITQINFSDFINKFPDLAPRTCDV